MRGGSCSGSHPASSERSPRTSSSSFGRVTPCGRGSLVRGILLTRRVDSHQDVVHRAAVTPSTAARARLSVIAALAALAAACVSASAATGAGSSLGADLAPVGACAGSTDAAASASVQERAMKCLVNWARARHGLRGLSSSGALKRAAALKGRDVVTCRQISHAPCGRGSTALVRQSGYRYARFAENLRMAPLSAASPRAIVAAWLRSPRHRANILQAAYRDLGAAFVLADGVFYDGPAVVWIVSFASPR